MKKLYNLCEAISAASGCLKHSILVVLLLSSSMLLAQSGKSVSGRVYDAITGEPLIGAAVVVQGTTRGVATSLKGEYAIDMSPADKMLVVSLIGYMTLEVPYAGQTKLDIAMGTEGISLDEVVVVGYGSMRKKDVTGAVSTITSERLTTPGVTSTEQLLQGAVAGLTVLQSSGSAAPDENSKILIRGRKSINANTDPLIVLDGVPYAGSMSDIAPQDIESINILKDASSAAIYGSRGSNGVIIITTKTSKAEDGVSINYSGYVSINKVSKFPAAMNAQEYYDYKQILIEEGALKADLDKWELENREAGISTNWAKELLKTAVSHNHALSVSGSSAKTKFMVSANYLDANGVSVNDQYRRGTGRVNLTTYIKPWLQFGTNSFFASVNRDGLGADLNQLLRTSPLTRARNDDGSVNFNLLYQNPTFKNPLERTTYDDRNRMQQYSTNNFLNVEVPGVKGLSYRLNTGLTAKYSDNTQYQSTETISGASNKGYGTIDNRRESSWTIENIVNYNRTFNDKHSLGLTALYSFENNRSEFRGLVGKGFPMDLTGYYGMTSASMNIDFKPGEKTYETGMISQMFRANYSYMSRYLVTATIRHDAYSGFGQDHKWGWFPSIALGWNISNEKFFKPLEDVINFMKIRLSYGQNGNQSVSPYGSIANFESLNNVDGSGASVPGYVQSSFGNSRLGWETTESYNLGVDYQLFNSRLSGSIEYYNTNTKDLLLKRSVSPTMGVGSGESYVFQNIGKTKNTGVEFNITSVNFRGDIFDWVTTFNVAYNKNRIVDLYGDGTDDVGNKWFIGSPVMSNYDYKFTGIYQLGQRELAAKYGAKPGYIKYLDVKPEADAAGNYKISPDDRVIQGSPEPNVTLGFGNTFNYRNFSLNFFFYGAFGAMRANWLMANDTFLKRDFWSETNPTNSYWSYDPQAYQYAGTGDQPAAYMFEKTNYLRLKDLTLSYTLPEKSLKSLKIDDLSIYFTARNLFTITSYGGYDPEFSTNQAIPVVREFIFGLNIRF